MVNLHFHEADTILQTPLHERLAAKERGALEELVTTYSAKLEIYIFRIIQGFGEIEDAEELTSDVFLKVWQDIDKYDPMRGTLGTWIYMIAKFTALDFRRKTSREWERKRAFIEKSVQDYKAKQNSLSLERIDRLQKLAEALRQLPKDIRELIYLRFVENRTYPEIAEMKGLPVGTIKSRMHRLKAKLREVLKPMTRT